MSCVNFITSYKFFKFCKIINIYKTFSKFVFQTFKNFDHYIIFFTIDRRIHTLTVKTIINETICDVSKNNVSTSKIFHICEKKALNLADEKWPQIFKIFLGLISLLQSPLRRSLSVKKRRAYQHNEKGRTHSFFENSLLCFPMHFSLLL